MTCIIGFVIPNIDNVAVSSLINIYNYMRKFPKKFNPIILSESDKFYNKYSDLYKIIKIEKNSNFDSLNLNYIFFLTPYQHCFTFNFSNISNKVKIMYVSYGYNTWGRSIYSIIFNTTFFRNVYMSFHETEHNKNDFINFAKQTELEFFNEDNVFVSGCPKIIDGYYNCDDNCIINNKKYNIIYNTRWSDDDGHTAHIFLNTIKKLIQLHDNIKITYRPHPLTNSKILDKMNELKCEKFVIERSDNYENMFMDFDIMISDASSFMTEFLSTGKPIIYTHKHDLFNTISKIFEKCYYKVTNEQELISIMNELVINKNDFKHDDRIKIIDKYFKVYKNPCKTISDILYDDYVSSNIEFDINEKSNITNDKISKWCNFTGFKTDRPYILYKYFLKYLQNINSILEYGCGHCEVSFKILYEKKNIIFTGVDIDDDLIKKNNVEFKKYNIKNYNFIVDDLCNTSIINKLNVYYDDFAIGGYGNYFSIDIISHTVNTIKPKYILFETHVKRQQELEIVKNLLFNENKYKCICAEKFKAHALCKLETYDYINRVVHIYEKNSK